MVLIRFMGIQICSKIKFKKTRGKQLRIKLRIAKVALKTKLRRRNKKLMTLRTNLLQTIRRRKFKAGLISLMTLMQPSARIMMCQIKKRQVIPKRCLVTLSLRILFSTSMVKRKNLKKRHFKQHLQTAHKMKQISTKKLKKTSSIQARIEFSKSLTAAKRQKNIEDQVNSNTK